MMTTPQLTFREHTGDKDWPSCVGATAYAAGIAWAKHVRAIKPFVYVPPKPYKFVPPSKQTIPGAAEFKRAYKAHLAANGPLVCPVEDWHVSAWTMPKRSRWQDCEMRLPTPPLHWTNREEVA